MDVSTLTNDQRKTLVESTFFDVEKVKLEGSRFGFQIRRKDNKKQIAEVSKKYTLVSNEQAVMPFIKKYGYGRLSDVVFSEGAFIYKFDLDEEIDFGGGDILRRQGYVANSYNKSLRFQWQDGFYRKVCSNGLFAFSRGINIDEVHYGDTNIEKLIAETLHSTDTLPDLELWKKFKSIPVPNGSKAQIISGFEPFEVKSEKTKLRHHPSETANKKIQYYSKINASKKGYDLENQENAWGLFNNLNWGISHAVDRKNVSRLISLNKKAEDYVANLYKLN